MYNFEFSHFTNNKNLELMKINPRFKKSLHRPPEKIMWLGDGVYFYTTGCSKSKKQGGSLVSNKSDFDKLSDTVVELKTTVDVTKNHVLDLRTSNGRDEVIKEIDTMAAEYMQAGFSEFSKTADNLKYVVGRIENFMPTSNKKYGDTLGKLINALTKRNNIMFEVVCCNFFAVPDKNHANAEAKIISGRLNSERKAVVQFCVLKEELIPDINFESLTVV